MVPLGGGVQGHHAHAAAGAVAARPAPRQVVAALPAHSDIIPQPQQSSQGSFDKYL